MHRRGYALILVIITASMPLVSFWQSAATADCALVNSRNDKVSGISTNSDLLPEEAIKRVTKNLRAYCCEQKYLRNTVDANGNDIIVCDQDKDIPTNGYFPQSTYLFDHLIDVMLRRLDGNENLIYPDVPVHEKGKERRELMRNYANNPDGNMPAAIVTSTNQYWNIDNGVLHTLYNEVCDTANAYYKNLRSNTPAARELPNAVKLCKELIREKTQYELMYARMIINLQANRMLGKSMTTHLVDYYANNRLMTLQSSIAEMVAAFTTVNRFVVEWTRQCSM